MQNVGDMQLRELCEHGDIMVQMFYGHISHVAGHVDGLCNLFRNKYETDLKIRPMIQTTLNYLQNRITQPILNGKVPYASEDVIADVTEVKTILHVWVLTCMLLETDFCNYLASQSADVNCFREWFERSRTVMSDYFTGMIPQSTTTNALPAVYSMNKIVVDLATMYLVFVPQKRKTNLPTTS